MCNRRHCVEEPGELVAASTWLSHLGNRRGTHTCEHHLQISDGTNKTDEKGTRKEQENDVENMKELNY